MNLKPGKIHRIASTWLATKSFIVGTRVLYVFKEFQKDNSILNIALGSIGLLIVVV